MGRPLFSTLVAPAEPAVRVAEVHTPSYQHWSYVNAFDPDADDFFEGENVVYEAFLTEEEIAAEAAAVATSVGAQVPEPQTSTSTELVNGNAPAMAISMRSRVLRAARAYMNTQEPAREDDRPELVAPADDDASSANDSSSSGRASPMEAEVGELASGMVAARRMDMDNFEYIPIAARFHEDDESSDADSDLAGLPSVPLPVSTQSQARSLPVTPTRARERRIRDTWTALDDADLSYPESPIPASAQAVPPPMTPPGSVTPRFLGWPLLPRAVDMSPSPTPNAPFGSARSVMPAYAAPPALHVHQ
ncbi:hypothetical protein EW145_g6626 [Phellinidium pouzarii]|uniref:Uncharacterized protein n=1 Tax=Phellinidium pouzarii TaxID=167371 RepID=A0A4S4KW19_9AGAM|nr:hypothetical protein EW145_g6626 [Phellinidium pouzarii]